MDCIGGMLNPIGKMPIKGGFVMVLLEKANGLYWYFNGNHCHFCDGFYWLFVLAGCTYLIWSRPMSGPVSV